MIASPLMFDLASISPHWEGYRIAELEAPIILGIARLREQSQGMACCIPSTTSRHTPA